MSDAAPATATYWAALSVSCPHCEARPGWACVDPYGREVDFPHLERVRAS